LMQLTRWRRAKMTETDLFVFALAAVHILFSMFDI